MTDVTWVWFQFALCAGLIGYAGSRLNRYGDALAELTGLSRSWMGLILVATVTSLPELVTGLSAVTLTKAPDMAVGDALGSCVFNLAFVEGPLLQHVSSIHVVSALTAALMSVALMVALLYRPAARVGRLFSWASLMLVVLYLLNAAYQYWQGH